MKERDMRQAPQRHRSVIRQRRHMAQEITFCGGGLRNPNAVQRDGLFASYAQAKERALAGARS